MAERHARRSGDGICLACRLEMRWGGGNSSSRRIDKPMNISLRDSSTMSGFKSEYGHGRRCFTRKSGAGERRSVGGGVRDRSTITSNSRLRAGTFNDTNRLGGVRSATFFGDRHVMDTRRIAGLWILQRQLYSTRGRGEGAGAGLPPRDERDRDKLSQLLEERMNGSEEEVTKIEGWEEILKEDEEEDEEVDLYRFVEEHEKSKRPDVSASNSVSEIYQNKSLEEESGRSNGAAGVDGEQTYTEDDVSEELIDEVEGPHNLERSVRAIRQAFGEELPDGLLTDEAHALYVRLYGVPLRGNGTRREEENYNTIDGEDGLEDAAEENALYKTGKDGKLEEVEYEDEEEAGNVTGMQDMRVMKAEEVIEAEHNNGRTDLAEKTHAAANENEKEVTTFDEPEDHTVRAHPLTEAGRFQTWPTTVQLSQSTFIKPVNDMLANVSNKHLKETAHEAFGGFGLPLSTATPKRSGQHIKQRPIALQAGQRHMSEREGDVFIAALMPGIYASVVSALTEVRRRLGSSWLEGLLRKNDDGHHEEDKNTPEEQNNDGNSDNNTVRGPRILDVGSGGAAVFAFREMLKAEWERMHDVPSFADNEKQTVGPPPPSPLESSSSSSSSRRRPTPVPTGKATVLTGSAALRYRASRLLSDTTFLPRMPDAVPDTTEPDPNTAQPRKRYDIIVASHTLWPLDEPYLRKQHVERLWSLLNPDGGVLLVLEKGLPRGFEAVAGARALLLDRLIASPGSSGYERVMPSAKKASKDTKPSSSSSSAPDVKTDPSSGSSTTSQFVEKEPGMIVAPCTNHSACPMYTRPGITTGRKDFCHFSQRFFRPQYLQNILGARDKNFDDVLFSYVAVQRGRDGRRRMKDNDRIDVDGVENHTGPFIAQGELATAAAFAGYEDEFMPSMPEASTSESTSPSNLDDTNLDDNTVDPTVTSKSTTKIPIEAYIPPNTTLNQTLLSVPRTVLPPLKRRGHVILDLCTPAGRLERWTVPRSFSKQAYRDARKSRWGDLWALGAKTRVIREPRVGKYGGKSRNASKVEDEDGNGKRNKKMDLGEEIFTGPGVNADGTIDDGIDENTERQFMEDMERDRRGFGGAGGGFNESMDKVAQFRNSAGINDGNNGISRFGRRKGNNRNNERRTGKAGRGEDDGFDGGILSTSESVSPLGDSSLLDALSLEEDEEQGESKRRRSRSEMGVERRERRVMMNGQEMGGGKRTKGRGTARKSGKEDKRRRGR